MPRSFEGELLPPSAETLPEGPFGEFTGYYAAESAAGPVMEVTAIHHRNDPILLGSPPMKPPRFHFGLPFRAASIWSNLECAGVTDVVGVWQHVSQLMTVVALKQRYAGHAKRAGLIAAANSYMGRLVVVVDDDVDPSNLNDVMWAVTTRCEPSEQIDIVRNAWSSALDPRIPPSHKLAASPRIPRRSSRRAGRSPGSDKFPPTSALSQDEARAIEEKWVGRIKRGLDQGQGCIVMPDTSGGGDAEPLALEPSEVAHAEHAILVQRLRDVDDGCAEAAAVVAAVEDDSEGRSFRHSVEEPSIRRQQRQIELAGDDRGCCGRAIVKTSGLDFEVELFEIALLTRDVECAAAHQRNVSHAHEVGGIGAIGRPEEDGLQAHSCRKQDFGRSRHVVSELTSSVPEINRIPVKINRIAARSWSTAMPTAGLQPIP
jgi:hypothetical protein